MDHSTTEENTKNAEDASQDSMSDDFDTMLRTLRDSIREAYRQLDGEAQSPDKGCAETPYSGDLYGVKMVFRSASTGEHHAIMFPRIYPSEARAAFIMNVFGNNPQYGGLIEKWHYQQLISFPMNSNVHTDAWEPVSVSVVKLAATPF